ncbi:MAG: hypothetical protein NC926_06675 [Candidatus Omnitrophica bacterium]|nr:hypothetical protein [Candidatus Omnitrophota bacterium]
MKKRERIMFMFLSLLNSCIFSNINFEENKDMIKIKKDALEIVFNKNSSYGTFSIFLGNEKICEIVPSFLKLYPTEEKGKYKTVPYWIPTGQQKLKYFVNKEPEKIEIVVLRDFDGDFYIKDYFIIENDSPLLAYISESKKNRENFSFEYIINFNLKNSDEIIWENNKTSPENLGDYWTKYIEVKNSRWICGYNKNKSYGIFIIRNFEFDPESAWHHYRLWSGPTLSSKITHRDYITRREFNFLIFENKKPEDIAKNLKFKEILPSTYTIENEKKVYPLFFKEEKVNIDGEINEKIWYELPKGSDFYKFEWSKKSYYYFPEKQTEFYAFYDKENIYFGVKCYEDDIKNLRYEQKTGSKNVWTDDCIEIFIQPKKSSYFQFIINPKGEKQDNRGLIEKWEAKGKIFDNFWSVELKIPFSILDTYPKDNEIWGFNVCRERRPKSELSCWNETSGFGGFHQVDKFGQLIFSPTLSPLNITIIEGKNTVGLLSEIVNFGKEKITESARILITIPEEKAIEEIYRFTIEKEERKYISFVQKGNIQKGYNVSFDITSRTGIPYYSKIFQKIGYSGLVSRLWPISYGNKIYIIEDRLQIFPFIFANYTDKEQNFSLVLMVPEEINLLYLDRLYNFSYGQFFPVEEVKEEKIIKDNIPYKKYTIKFSKKISPRNLPIQDEERNYERLIMPFYMEKTSLKNFKIFFHIENEQLKEKENIYDVSVVPSFKSKLPKTIETGVFTWYFGSIQDSVKDELKKEVAIKHALSLKDSGFNTIVYKVANKEIRDTLNKEGIRIRPSFWWFWWDKEYLEKNPEGYAIDFSGKKAKYGGIDTVCPMLLINDENAFENTRKIVQRLITENGNDIWHDTEGPCSWEVCFCERCINEFKKFAKIPENERLDPKIIKLKYRDEWLKFADWQQAIIFSKINKTIKEINPDAKFANYGGLSEPEHRCNWEMLSKYNSIDIAGPSMYELTPLTLKYWEKEMEEFKKKVSNLKITPWLNNEARQTNYKLLRTQALKSITIGTDGYHIYYGQLLFRDGRRLYDLGVVNTIISDFEDFFIKGEKLKGELFSDIDKENYSVDGWQLGDEKVIFVYNHDDKNKKELKIRLPFDLKDNVIFDYMNKEKMQNEKEIKLILEDLDIKVIYIGPERKLKERMKIWEEKQLRFYKEDD